MTFHSRGAGSEVMSLRLGSHLLSLHLRVGHRPHHKCFAHTCAFSIWAPSWVHNPHASSRGFTGGATLPSTQQPLIESCREVCGKKPSAVLEGALVPG